MLHSKGKTAVNDLLTVLNTREAANETCAVKAVKDVQRACSLLQSCLKSLTSAASAAVAQSLQLADRLLDCLPDAEDVKQLPINPQRSILSTLKQAFELLLLWQSLPPEQQPAAFHFLQVGSSCPVCHEKQCHGDAAFSPSCPA